MSSSLNVSSGWLGLRYLVIYKLRGNKKDMGKESSAGEDVARLAGRLVKLEKLYVIR